MSRSRETSSGTLASQRAHAGPPTYTCMPLQNTLGGPAAIATRYGGGTPGQPLLSVDLLSCIFHLDGTRTRITGKSYLLQ